MLSEAEAAEALKKFVQKNRKADRSKFISTPTPVLTPATWKGHLSQCDRTSYCFVTL